MTATDPSQIALAPQFVSQTPDGRVFVSVVPQVMTPAAAENLAAQLTAAAEIAASASSGLVVARELIRRPGR